MIFFPICWKNYDLKKIPAFFSLADLGWYKVELLETDYQELFDVNYSKAVSKVLQEKFVHTSKEDFVIWSTRGARQPFGYVVLEFHCKKSAEHRGFHLAFVKKEQLPEGQKPFVYFEKNNQCFKIKNTGALIHKYYK